MEKTAAEFLNDSASQYQSTIIKGWENLYRKKSAYAYEKAKSYFVPGSALELGCADGEVTERILKDFDRLTVVEGSALFSAQIRERIPDPKLEVVTALFEDYMPEKLFNTIFAEHILEHLTDPVGVLKCVRRWLAPKGRIIIVVPNANSLHRLIGVKLGMLSNKHELNEQDIQLGHQRVYDMALLQKHIQEAGLTPIHSSGLMIKPLSNRQIENQWSEELVDAFFALGEDLPELCSELFVVAQA